MTYKPKGCLPIFVLSMGYLILAYIIVGVLVIGFRIDVAGVDAPTIIVNRIKLLGLLLLGTSPISILGVLLIHFFSASNIN